MKMSQRLSQTQLRQVVCSKRVFHRRCYLDIQHAGDISLDMGLKMPGEGHIVRRTWKSIASNIKSAMRRQWVAVGTLVPYMYSPATLQQLSRIDSNCRLLTAIGTIPSLDGFYIAGLPASARPSIPHERLLSTAKTLQSSDFTVYRHTCQYEWRQR